MCEPDFYYENFKEGNKLDIIRCEEWVILKLNGGKIFDGEEVPDSLWMDLIMMKIDKINRKFIKVEEMEDYT